MKKYHPSDVIWGYAFLLPAVILAVVFVLIPILMSFSYSITDYNLLKPFAYKYIGLKNFTRLFHDELFFTSFRNTVYFVVLVLPIQLSIALMLASIVNRKFRMNTMIRVMYFSPAVLSLVVVSILWRVLLNPTSGLINELLQLIHLSPQPFLSSTIQAMPTIVVISAWSGCGYQMIIFLAGLKNIDSFMYEAARIDGAKSWQQFWHITLPSLRPITMFLVITTTIQAFKLIVQPMVMTAGGPDYSTMTILQYIYEYGFRHRNTGYVSAISLLFTVFLIIISILLRKILKEE